jgi:hypothetical protein
MFKTKIRREVAGLFIIPLVIWCFLPGFLKIWETYTSFWLIDNTISAIVITLIFGIMAVKYGVTWKKEDQKESESYFSRHIGGVRFWVALY